MSDIFSRSSFRRLQTRTSGPVGVALIRTRADGEDETLDLGDVDTAAAWSTSKVPLVMAALSRSETPSERALARRAITISDNAAARELWSHLGTPKAAGQQVEHELRLAGDRRTKVEYNQIRPSYTPFGQTDWALHDQAQFAAYLMCSPRASVVRSYMNQISPGQRWGLGRIDGIAFKGGWGPDLRGAGYLVRQIGSLQTSDGSTWGIAIAVQSSRGFSAGTRDLSLIADWIDRRWQRHELTVRTKRSRCLDR